MTDFEKFEAEFLSEEKEILVLIKVSTNGAMKYGEAWRPCNMPLAFIDLQTDTLYEKGCRLEWLVEDSKNWKYYFAPQKAYRLRVRPKKPTAEKEFIPTFMLIEVLEENIENQCFTEILQKFNKEKTYEDERFQLKFNKNQDCFEGKEKEKSYSLTVETDDLQELREILAEYQSLTKDFAKWQENVKNFASEKLLDLANKWAKSEDNNLIISKKEFVEKINLSSVNLEGDSICIYLSDGDLFFGHIISVYGKLDGSLRMATIEG